MSESEPGRDDILKLARLAGLHLSAPYETELVDAYKHVRRLIDRLPEPVSRTSEPAHTFAPEKFGVTTGEDDGR
jgi:hypothetical protein